MKQKEWQITGFTTPYWFKAPNLAVASVAVALLGRGNIGVRLIGGSEAMPPRMSRLQLQAWSKRHFDMAFPQVEAKVARNYVTELINALESVQIGLPGEGGLVRPARDLEPAAHRAAQNVKHYLVRRLDEQRARMPQ